jgi:hypothetical protein
LLKRLQQWYLPLRTTHPQPLRLQRLLRILMQLKLQRFAPQSMPWIA